MKATLLYLSIPVAAALAFSPAPSLPSQDPQNPAEENIKVMPISALQYVTASGERQTVRAENIVEIRVFEDHSDSVRIELLYENGDYSLIDAQSMHIMRRTGAPRDVRLVRTQRSKMRFPWLP